MLYVLNLLLIFCEKSQLRVKTIRPKFFHVSVYHYFCIYWQNIAGFKTQLVDYLYNSTKQLFCFLCSRIFWSDTFEPKLTCWLNFNPKNWKTKEWNRTLPMIVFSTLAYLPKCNGIGGYIRKASFKHSIYIRQKDLEFPHPRGFFSNFHSSFPRERNLGFTKSSRKSET